MIPGGLADARVDARHPAVIASVEGCWTTFRRAQNKIRHHGCVQIKRQSQVGVDDLRQLVGVATQRERVHPP